MVQWPELLIIFPLCSLVWLPVYMVTLMLLPSLTLITLPSYNSDLSSGLLEFIETFFYYGRVQIDYKV